MRKPVLLSLFIALLALAASGCQPGAATPAEKPTAPSTATPTEEPLPEGPSLGDTVTRSSDGMVMVCVMGQNSL